MGTLMAAYFVGLGAVAAYVGWMAVQNRRLAGRLEELETLLEERAGADPSRSRAA